MSGRVILVRINRANSLARGCLKTNLRHQQKNKIQGVMTFALKALIAAMVQFPMKTEIKTPLWAIFPRLGWLRRLIRKNRMPLSTRKLPTMFNKKTPKDALWNTASSRENIYDNSAHPLAPATEGYGLSCGVLGWCCLCFVKESSHSYSREIDRYDQDRCYWPILVVILSMTSCVGFMKATVESSVDATT